MKNKFPPRPVTPVEVSSTDCSTPFHVDEDLENSIIECRRYIWKVSDSDNLFFKIICDAKDSFTLFEQHLIEQLHPVQLCYEKLLTFDCRSMGVLYPLVSGDIKKEDK